MLYSLVIWMSYNIIWVWVWLLLERDIIVGIYSTSSHKTYVSPTVWSPKKPSYEINGTNDGPNNYLLKVKLNKGPHPVTYDPPPHNLRLAFISVVYGIFTHIVSSDMWFLYLIYFFVHRKIQYRSNKNRGVLQWFILWEYNYSNKQLKKPPDTWRRILLLLNTMIQKIMTISTFAHVMIYLVVCCIG